MPEQKLWSKLRNRQIENHKFRRQFSIGNFIADFYCPALKLVIEIDGASHDGEERQSYDRWREKYLASLGIKCLRFTNEEVMKNLDGVLVAISTHITERAKELKRSKRKI